MATESLPLSPTAFAEAIQELPLSSVYSKVAELRNSIAHLHRSNAELRLFLTESQDPEEEKKELEGYIVENERVVTSMNERIGLLRTELERRGQPSLEDVLEGAQNKDRDMNGESQGPGSGGAGAPATDGANGANGGAGGQGNSGEDGVYL